MDDVLLFYYFVESERNPREDPLLLWLSGGLVVLHFLVLYMKLVYFLSPIYIISRKEDLKKDNKIQ